MEPTTNKSELNTRALLMRAAAKVFADSGLQGATVRAIADQAGVANQVITYHFGSKERLWRDVVDWLFESVTEVSETVRWTPGVGSDDEQFLRHLRNMMEYRAEKVLLRRILIREGRDDSESKKYAYRLLEKVLANNLRFFEDAYEAGVARQALPVEMHALFVGFSSWWSVQPQEVKMTLGIDPATDGSADVASRQLFKIFTGRTP